MKLSEHAGKNTNLSVLDKIVLHAMFVATGAAQAFGIDGFIYIDTLKIKEEAAFLLWHYERDEYHIFVPTLGLVMLAANSDREFEGKLELNIDDKILAALCELE